MLILFMRRILTALDINPRSPKQLATVHSIEINFAQLSWGAILIDGEVILKSGKSWSTPAMLAEWAESEAA